MSLRRRYLRPTSFARRIHEIDVDALRRDGVRGIIMDLDNTLVGYRLAAPDAEVAAWIARATSRGLEAVVVTNNTTPWAQGVAQELHVRCIANARKPSPRGFLAALKMLETSHSETIVIGDQLFTDVLGAKLFGMKVILTEPIVAHEQWWMWPIRLLEHLVLYRVPRA